MTFLFRARSAVLALLFILGTSAHAAIDPYEFPNEELQERYSNLIEEMRCPKCQNQNLAGSNSPISNDLRREIRRLLEEGKSDEEITAFLVSRYGDFIRYRPAVKGNTLLLWFTPAALLLVGLAIVLLVVRRHRKAVGSEQGLDPEEEARLKQLLDSSAEGKKE